MVRIARLTKGKGRRKAALGATLALALVACRQTPSSQQPPEPGDQAVARVDGETVWASDVKREAVAEGKIGSGDPLDSSSNLFHQMLDEVIDTKVMAAEALRQRLDADPLAQRRLAAARERTLQGLLVESVVAKAVNAGAVQALYQEYAKLQTPSEEIHLRQIVVATEADADAMKKQLAGGAAFEALALERSTDADTRFKGGDLGEMTVDTLPEPLAQALKGVKPGQLAGPVKVDAGWAVLRVDDRRPEPPKSLDQMRPTLIHFITYDQIKDLTLRLRSRAKIETLIAPPPETSGPPSEPASAPPEGANALTNAAAAGNALRP
jgi:peptidyl-prolyl cis-trans isomerase C